MKLKGVPFFCVITITVFWFGSFLSLETKRDMVDLPKVSVFFSFTSFYFLGSAAFIILAIDLGVMCC